MSVAARMALALCAAHLALIAGLWLWSQSVLGMGLALLLMAPVPGFLRRRPRTAAWATLLLSFYVGGLLAEGYARPAEREPAFALAALAALDFLLLILSVRVWTRAPHEGPAARTAGSDGAAH